MRELRIDSYPLEWDKSRPRASPVQNGVEHPSYLAARRVTIPVRLFQSADEQEARADAAVEHLIDREPEMFMDPAEEGSARNHGLPDSV